LSDIQAVLSPDMSGMIRDDIRERWTL